MKTNACLSAALVLSFGLCADQACATPLQFHVSPAGSDSRDGIRAGNSWLRKSVGPFQTLERARDEIRRLRREEGSLPKGGVEVILEPGVYRLSAPFMLTAEDSGTEEAPVVYRAARRGTAILSGGVRLAGWRPADTPAARKLTAPAAKGRLVCADIGDDLIDPIPGFANGGCGFKGEPEYPIALYQNGERLPISRWPNAGYATMGECLGESVDWGRGIRFTEGIFRFDNARLERWAGEPELWLDGLWYWHWADQKMQLKEIDLGKRTISLRNPQTHAFGFKAGQSFFAFNAISEIDRPGEWAVDREARRIYLWPAADPEKYPVTLARRKNLIQAQGISHVRFEDLVFEHVLETAIVIQDATAVEVSGSTIRHTGSWAVDVEEGHDCSVYGCDLYDLGEGGAKVTGGDQETLTPGNHMIENNHIHHFGGVVNTYRYGAAVYGVGNAIRHNLLHHAQHTALFFRGNDHAVEYNIIHDICLHSSDAGAIHPCARDWSLRGCVIRHNFFHHTGKGMDGCGCHGIYLDDYTSGATIVSNICSMVGHSVTTCGNGNRIENNISINSRKSSFSLSSRGIDSFARKNAERGMDSPMIRKLLREDKPYCSERWRERYPNLGPLQDMIGTDPVGAHDSHFCTMRNNVNVAGLPIHISNEKKVRRTCTITDNIDVTEDPGFVDYEHFDLRLRPDSIIYEKLPDFQVPDFEKMGLYDSPRRASPAVKFGADITPMTPILPPAEREKAERCIPYHIPAISAPITIDGVRDTAEWPGDMPPTAVLEWEGMKEAPITSLVWIGTDSENLYLVFQNGLASRVRATKGHTWGLDDGIEVALAVAREPGVVRGVPPVTTVLRGYPDGYVECVTDGGLHEHQARQIEQAVTYAATRRHRGTWSAELRIPFSVLGLCAGEPNRPVLAHLCAYQAAAKRVVSWRRRRALHTWDVRQGCALCFDALGPVAFAPDCPPSEVRIDVQADRTAEEPTLAPGKGADMPEWARKWNRVVAEFGATRADRWQEYEFEFMPLADGVVSFQLMGTYASAQGSLLSTWTYYDTIEVTGAHLVNGDFEAVADNGKPAGWECVCDQNWQSSPSSESGLVERPAMAASGKRMAMACCEHRVVQNLTVVKGKKVTVRFQARAVTP